MAYCAGSRRERGFTLVELMVVVAIVAILAAIAVVSVTSTGYARTTRGYAQEIAALSELARMRAVANARYQRLVFSANQVVHQEVDGDNLGMIDTDSLTDGDWREVSVLAAPRDVAIAGSEEGADESGGKTPLGTFTAVEFAPDGTARAAGADAGATVFVRDDRDTRAVVLIFRLTGVAYAYDGW